MKQCESWCICKCNQQGCGCHLGGRASMLPAQDKPPPKQPKKKKAKR